MFVFSAGLTDTCRVLLLPQQLRQLREIRRDLRRLIASDVESSSPAWCKSYRSGSLRKP